MTKKKATTGNVTLTPLLTINEVLAILRVSRSTFDLLVRNGELTVIKYQRSVRVEVAEVQRWIETHRHAS